jgi:hypothetical protein
MEGTMALISSGGDTGIRSVAASLILGRNGSLILRQTNQGYELAGLDQKGAVFCDDWAAAERILFRLNIPFHKIDEIKSLLCPGTQVVVHRELSK